MSWRIAVLRSYPVRISEWRSLEAVLCMTAAERDAYRNLIDICWRDGSLPRADRELQALSLSTDREWKRSCVAVKKQFRESDGRLWSDLVSQSRRRGLLSQQPGTDTQSRRRYLRMKTAGGKICPSIRALIFGRDGHECRYCGSLSALTIDHITPIAKGGTNSTDNLQTLCRSCNARKKDRHGER